MNLFYGLCFLDCDFREGKTKKCTKILSGNDVTLKVRYVASYCSLSTLYPSL